VKSWLVIQPLKNLVAMNVISFTFFFCRLKVTIGESLNVTWLNAVLGRDNNINAFIERKVIGYEIHKFNPLSDFVLLVKLVLDAWQHPLPTEMCTTVLCANATRK